MNHYASPEFWARYRALPAEIKSLADRSFALLQTNRHARQQRGASADIDARADANRTNLELRGDDRYVRRETGMSRTQNTGTGADADCIADFQIASVNEALRSDPDLIADCAATVMAPLQHHLVTDEQTRAKLETIQMGEADALTDRGAIAQTQRHRASQHAAHRGVECVASVGEAIPQRVQGFVRALRAQRLREPQFVGRVRIDHALRKVSGNASSRSG